MENQLSLELKKQKMLIEYKTAIISAIELIIDNIEAQKELFNAIKEGRDNKIVDSTSKKKEGFLKSIDRYSSLKTKIENNAKLSKADYSLLAVACTGASNSIASSAQQLLDSLEQLQNLAKIFMT